MKLFQWRSLQTRVTLFTLIISLLGMGALALYASRVLRADLQRQAGEQQRSTVSLLAAEIDGALDERFSLLAELAGRLSPQALSQPAALQAALQAHLSLSIHFNGGAFVTGTDGLVRASNALAAERPGVSVMDRDYMIAALQQGKATVGRPVLGKNLKVPVLVMAVPVRDAGGAVIGALAGVINLGMPNFLDRVTKSRYGQTGGYRLVARQHRLIVTASDSRRIMETLPAPGINPLLDRFIQGDEGSGVTVSPLGVEILASAKNIPAAGWYVSALLPTDEAFAPIRELQQLMLLATLLLSAMIGAVSWWMLRRQLSPLVATANTLADWSDSRPPAQPLPIGRADEVGTLIASFNRLLVILEQREATLLESKRSLQESQQIAGLGSYVLDLPSGSWKSSDVFDRVCGIDRSYARSLEAWVALIHPADRTMMADYLGADILAQRQGFDKEYRVLRPSDQATRWVHGLGQLEFDAQGQPRQLRGTLQDITERRLAAQREACRSHILELLAGAEPLDSLLVSMVHCVEQVDPALRVSILLLAHDGAPLLTAAAPSLPAAFNAALDGLEIVPAVDAAGARLFGAERSSVVDIALCPAWTPWKEQAARAGLAACWSQPICAASDQLLGVFAIYHPDLNSPADCEMALIEQAARLASIAIERRTAAAQLHDSEARYRTLVEWSPEPILVHRFGEILYVNASAVQLFGARGASDLVGKRTLDLIHPDFRDTQLTRMQQLHDGVAIEPMVESRFLKLDGSVIDVEVQGTAMSFDGAPAIHVCVRDITARKRAEEQLRLSASVFTHAREGIMITTADGAIIDVNAAFTRITGYRRDEVLGRNPRLLGSGRQDKAYYFAMWRGLTAQGHWYGEIWNRRKNGEVYAAMQTISAVRDAQGQTSQYMALFSDITAAKEQQRQLEHIAHYDPLTQLPNRVLLADRLHQGMAQTQRRGQRLAVVFLDLDGFKAVNDQHGHMAGDQLLITVASRMKQALREGDTLARLGGDEFVAVLVDLPDQDASEPMLRRLLAAAAEPVLFGAAQLQVSASLGVTFFPQAAEIDADQLLRQADHAMYQAKLTGKNRFHRFGAEQAQRQPDPPLPLRA